MSMRGKYDDLSKLVTMMTGAKLALVLVHGGAKGNGLSVSCTDPALAALVPVMLRDVADLIEQQQAQQPTIFVADDEPTGPGH